MKINFSSSPSRDFSLCILISVITIFSTNILSIGWADFIIGFPVISFLPGYSWVSLFYPIKDSKSEQVTFTDVREFSRLPSTSDRLILSVFISLAITSVIQFYQITYNILPEGNLLTSMSVIYLLLGSLSYLRSLQISADDLFIFSFELEIKTPFELDRGTKTQLTSLIIVIFLSIPAMQSIQEYDDPGYSEIFILNSDREANGYVIQTNQGEAFSIFIGINNHHGETYQYRLESSKGNYGPPSNPQEVPLSTELNFEEFSLLDEGELISETAFSFQESGLWKLEYELYGGENDNQNEALGNVFLWISVT